VLPPRCHALAERYAAGVGTHPTGPPLHRLAGALDPENRRHHGKIVWNDSDSYGESLVSAVASIPMQLVGMGNDAFEAVSWKLARRIPDARR